MGESKQSLQLNDNPFNCNKIEINQLLTKLIECFDKYKKNKQIKNMNTNTCKIHLNRIYQYYCKDCRVNLCEECIKSGKHVTHSKEILKEIQLSEEENNLSEEIIKYYVEIIKYITKEKTEELKASFDKKIMNENKK